MDLNQKVKVDKSSRRVQNFAKKYNLDSEKIVNQINVGDKLFKIDNTEVNVDSITFDSSDTAYWIQTLKSSESFNYFVNDILIKIK